MIDKFEILQIAKKFKLQNTTIEKDYVLGWILMGMQEQSKIVPHWLFKGGTCLKKCYFDDYRFSEDLDFTVTNESQKNSETLRQLLIKLAEWVYETSRIHIPKESITVELYENPRGFTSAQGKLSYLGPLRQKRTSNLPTIKFDFTFHEKVVLEPEQRKIFHNYSDRPQNPPRVFAYSFEEIFAEKLRALAERARPRDLYDINQLYQQRHLLKSKNQLIDSLEKKCQFKGLPMPSLKMLENHTGKGLLSTEWDNMLKHQLVDLKPFEVFWHKLPQIFNWLYAENKPLPDFSHQK